MIKGQVMVKVPASTANLGPGFDTLGMALSLYAWIEMEVAKNGVTVIELHGDSMDGIPTDKTNLIYKVAGMVFQEAGLQTPELRIAMYSDIPLTRGLGSSASAIVGALVAANALAGSPLSEDKLFQMASELEGHPDNVGASFFGGIVVSAWDGERAEKVRIVPHENLEVLVAIPAFQLATDKARSALPDKLDMKDAVFNIASSSLLVAAFASGRLDLISYAMRDKLHQPYRAPLVPGMSDILANATNHGALGVALSGAGPTLLTLVDRSSDRKAELEAFLLNTLRTHGVEAETIWLSPALNGTELSIFGAADATVSFMERIKGEVRA